MLGRDEIAGCSARAYTTLSLSDAKKLMMFSSDEELMVYADEVRDTPTKSGEAGASQADHINVVALHLLCISLTAM